MQPLDAANGLEANIEIILQRRRKRQNKQSSGFFGDASAGSTLSSLQESVASLSSSIKEFSQAHLERKSSGRQRLAARVQDDSPKIAKLHRKDRVPHGSFPSTTASLPESTAVASPAAAAHSALKQQANNLPAQTVLSSQHIFDLGLSTLNSACQLLLRGTSALCQLKRGGLQKDLSSQRVDTDALQPAFVFLGRGASALCAFWKDAHGEPSTQEAFILRLSALSEVRLHEQPEQRAATLHAQHIAIDVLFPDAQARSDWVTALFLLRSCQPGALPPHSADDEAD